MIPIILNLSDIKELQAGKDVDFKYSCFAAEGQLFTPAIYIPGIDSRYFADVFGNIWSNMLNELRILHGSFNNKKWLQVNPKEGNKYPSRLIHQLVASAFYTKPDSYTFIRHLDGDKLNNRPSNLKWYGSALNELVESFQVIVRNNKLVRC